MTGSQIQQSTNPARPFVIGLLMTISSLIIFFTHDSRLEAWLLSCGTDIYTYSSECASNTLNLSMTIWGFAFIIGICGVFVFIYYGIKLTRFRQISNIPKISNAQTSNSLEAELNRLNDLKTRSVITDDEYNTLRKKLIEKD
jgi:hypothetical protein